MTITNIQDNMLNSKRATLVSTKIYYIPHTRSNPDPQLYKTVDISKTPSDHYKYNGNSTCKVKKA